MHAKLRKLVVAHTHTLNIRTGASTANLVRPSNIITKYAHDFFSLFFIFFLGGLHYRIDSRPQPIDMTVVQFILRLPQGIN